MPNKKIPYSVSVIIPAFNESANLESIIEDCDRNLTSLTSKYEVIVIDDCSTDSTQEVLGKLEKIYPCLKVNCNKKNIGCHPSCLVGFQKASNDVLVFLPADGQVPANNIPKFLETIDRFDLVCSYRRQREDTFFRQLASRLYNIVLRFLFKINLHDTHSAIAVKKVVVKEIGNKIKSHSSFTSCEFILQAINNGFKVTEIEVEHLPRKAGHATGANLRDAIWTPINLLEFWART